MRTITINSDASTIAIIALAGSDSRPGTVPDGLPRDEKQTAPKGTIQLQFDHCLAAELVERIRSSDRHQG